MPRAWILSVQWDRAGVPPALLPAVVNPGLCARRNLQRDEAASFVNQSPNCASRTAASATFRMWLYYPAVVVSDLQASTFHQQTKQNYWEERKNTDFAAGKLLCLFLESIINCNSVVCTVYNAVLVSRLETDGALLWLTYLLREKYSLQYSSEHNFCLLYTGTWYSIIDYRGFWHERQYRMVTVPYVINSAVTHE